MIKKNFNPYKEIGIEQKVRLVVYDTESKAFIKKDIIDTYQSLDIVFSEKYDVNSLRYKYQIISREGKWENYTRYSHIFKRSSYSSALAESFNFNKIDENNISQLENLSEGQANYYFKRLLKNYYYYLLSSPNLVKVNKVSSYMSLIPLNLIRSSNIVAHCYTLIVIITDYVKRTLSNEDGLVSKERAILWYEESIEKYKFDTENLLGFKTGALVANGHIASSYDRKLTFECYQKALKLGEGFIESFLLIDPLSTYYSEISGINRTYEIIIGDTPNSNINLTSSEGGTNICFSTDIKYFQIYASNWANANFYFEKLILNFGIVTNSEEEYYHCVDSYQSIIKSIAKLLEVDIPNNYRFFWIKSTIINKTVYACARFYLAKYLVNNYDENIFISDIDQLVVGDFEKYLQSFNDNKYSVYLPISPSFFSMLPGRSHLADNIFIRNDKKGKDYCELLTNYVGMGIDESFSWILDQNATRYASEFIEVGNLDSYGKRVLRQYPNLKQKQLKTLK